MLLVVLIAYVVSAWGGLIPASVGVFVLAGATWLAWRRLMIAPADTTAPVPAARPVEGHT